MTDARDKDGKLLPDKDRLTSFGKFLRSSSLDELPEFFNILKGDMSFIGPRPLLVSYLPYYTERESLRHTVRPGLTGLAQVSGRNFIDWDRRLAKDVEYVEGLSFLMDLKVLFLSVKRKRSAVLMLQRIRISRRAILHRSGKSGWSARESWKRERTAGLTAESAGSAA